MLARLIATVAAAALATTAAAQNVNEPPNGRLYLGAWLDTADSAPGVGDGDRPVRMDQRLGFNLSSFQYAQNIPIDTFPFPIEQVEATGTDSLIYLTVYPRPTPWTVTDEQITNLTRQCGIINSQGRRVLVRFGPEMNGDWNYYGQQPSRYIALWRRVFAAMRRDAPQTGLVWAPSSGNGSTSPCRLTNRCMMLRNRSIPCLHPHDIPPEEFALLDTNKDGTINAQDDPYSPYYPGDEYVDWVGVSIYHYGPTYPWQDNTIAPLGKFESFLNVGNFYQTYSVAKNKPLMIAETAAAFHVNSPTGPGVGELATKQPWWRQYITNATFLDAYPKVKLISLFEFRKFEEVNTLGQPDDRDFRITNNTEILNAFKQDFAAVRSRYIESGPLRPNGGAPAPLPSAVISGGNGGNGGSSTGSNTGSSKSDSDRIRLTAAVSTVAGIALILLAAA
ncbi:glycoside hydrolase superfamily [Entophlyctis helioformis]|nr:glycoside hydrolase superfamily [Entophlyctis helioformis]